MAAYSLTGKVALVTGAARGIGFETAKLLHARGAAVTVLDLDQGAAERAAASIGSDRTFAIGADVTDREAMVAAVASTIERFGGLDVAIANAGIAPTGATVRVMDPDAFERVVEVNLLGVYRTVYAALPQVVARQGHVVVIASIYAFMNGLLLAPYACTKAGVEQLGRVLRTELVRHGASASVAYFGFIDTDMVRQGFEHDPLAAQMQELMPALIRRRLQPEQAAKRIVTGIERRSPRIIAPRYWTVMSVLRGILNPILDRGSERYEALQDLIAQSDVANRVDGPKVTVAAGSEAELDRAVR